MRCLPKIPDRFWEKVEKTEHCWIWTGATDRKGYGRVGVGGRRDGTTGSHIWSCTESHGVKPGPDFMALHSCDNPPCVNPAHLRWGTAAENSAEMVERGHSTKQTHCKRGHQLSEENTYAWGACKLCARYRARQRREKND